MQSWMIGTVLGVFAVGVMATLPAISTCGGVLLAAVVCALRWRHRTTLFILGCACGLSWATYRGGLLLQERLPEHLQQQQLALVGIVSEPPQLRVFSDGKRRQRFAVQVQSLTCPPAIVPCANRVRKVLLSYYGDQVIRAGERWRFQVRLKRPWGLSNPGSFNYQSWLAQYRFGATGVVATVELQRLEPPAAYRWWIQHWRQQLAEQLRDVVGTRPEHGVLLALSIGQRSAISHAQWRQFQQFGLNHLVVISGLHVGLVAGIGFLLGRFIGGALALVWVGFYAGRLAHPAALLLALVYSALAGFALPTVRALLMLASVQLIALSGRRVRALPVLSLALLGVALLDPLAAHNAGFWLSFGAVALIFYLLAVKPMLQGWRLALALQLVLSLGTGVLGSYWFGGSSAISPLANLVAIPVLAFLLAPLCLLAALLALVLPQAADAVWQLSALPVQGFFALADGVDSSAFWLSHMQPGWVVVTSLAAMFWLLGPGWLPLRTIAPLLFLPLVVLSPQRLPPGRLELTVLDVGQGLAVVVRTPQTLLLYDTGAGEPQAANMANAVILPFLARARAPGVDALVISHGDRDHAAGLPTLREALAVEQVWLGEPGADLEVPNRPCVAGHHGKLGDLFWWQLHPELAGRDQGLVAGPAAGAGPSSNDQSCVLMLEFQGFRVLLPGDIGKQVERNLVQRWGDSLRADVLVAPHHGSKTSSGPAFLNRVMATHVVFTTGYRNSFGHPHAVVARRHLARGSTLYNTAYTGALTFVVEEGRLLEVRAWREERAYYWQ